MKSEQKVKIGPKDNQVDPNIKIDDVEGSLNKEGENTNLIDQKFTENNQNPASSDNVNFYPEEDKKWPEEAYNPEKPGSMPITESHFKELEMTNTPLVGTLSKKMMDKENEEKRMVTMNPFSKAVQDSHQKYQEK